MNKSVIILGGAGFIGKNVRKLGKEYTNLELCYGDLNCEVDTPNTKRIDILKYSDFEDKCKSFDVIVNLTGQITKPIAKCFELNSTGINNIAKFANKYDKKVIQLSTVAVYGTREFASEEMDVNPESVYGSCKVFSEFILSNTIKKENLIILRLSNIYGEQQDKGLFAYLRNSYLTDKKLNFTNNGNLLRYFLSVQDLSNALLRILMIDDLNGIYNIVGNKSYSIAEIIKMVEDLKNIKYNVEYTNAAPIENINQLSYEKIDKVISIKFTETVENFITNNFLND